MNGKQELMRRLVVIQAIASLGWIALGLGVFGLTAEDPAGLHVMFAQRGVNLALVAGGLIVALIEIRLMLPILRALRAQSSGGRS